ncbi:hypothetical protein KFE98_12940 [bacterium SCSIO 12741]|nr:hypothetical protein KFE98_12940 [bacterium SCSIO 12741]
MATSFAHIAYIEKEKINSLQFPKGDVLQEDDARSKRSVIIDQAIDAGNFAQFKVLIVFEDLDGLKEVETTIWGRDKRSILLKNGIRIPVERIHKVRFN